MKTVPQCQPATSGIWRRKLVGQRKSAIYLAGILLAITIYRFELLKLGTNDLLSHTFRTSWGDRFCRHIQPISDIYPGRNRSRFLSQHGQDVWILKNLIQVLDERVGGNPRTFLEFGARNGIDHSNTFYYDKFEGYNGVLIEASPYDYPNLKKNRERNGVQTLHGLVCDSSQEKHEKKFHALSGGLAGLGMLESEEANARLKRLVNEAKSKNKTIEKSSIELQCISLKTALKNANINAITIFSADCEGCELDVLRDFDFDAVQVWVLLVERSPDCSYTHELMKTIEQHGFVAMNWDSSDVIFLNAALWKRIFYQ